MSTIEMKYKAINLLINSNEDSVIKKVIEILSKENKSDLRSEELQEALRDSEKSFNDGNYSNHNKVMDRMKNKFPKLHE